MPLRRDAQRGLDRRCVTAQEIGHTPPTQKPIYPAPIMAKINYVEYKIQERDGSTSEFRLSDSWRLEERAIQLSEGSGWSATVGFEDLSIALRERDKGTIEAQGNHGDPDRDKPRTQTKVRGEAVKWAVERIEKLHARRTIAGENTTVTGHITGEGLSLREQFMIIDGKGLMDPVGYTWRRHYLRGAATILACGFGDKRSLSANDVRYVYLKRSGCWPDGRQADRDDLLKRGIRDHALDVVIQGRRVSLGKCSASTVRRGLEACRAAMGELLKDEDPNGRPYIAYSVLDKKDLCGTAKRAKTANATRERFRWMMRAAEEAVRRRNTSAYEGLRSRNRLDLYRQFFPPLLRCLIAEAGYTGQRIDGILHLRIDDALLTQAAMRRALRDCLDEEVDESWYETWEHGAQYFRREFAKANPQHAGYDRPIPMSSTMRRELNRYLGERERAGITSEWLFPDPNDPSQPLHYRDALDLIHACEAIAREMVTLAGGDPDDVIPPVEKPWHCYCGFWEDTRDELGWADNKNASWAFGRTTNVGTPQKRAYRQLKPHFIFACIEGMNVIEAMQAFGEMEEARASVREPIPFGDDHQPAARAVAA